MVFQTKWQVRGFASVKWIISNSHSRESQGISIY
jgi:hypothetical protein